MKRLRWLASGVGEPDLVDLGAQPGGRSNDKANGVANDADTDVAIDGPHGLRYQTDRPVTR